MENASKALLIAAAVLIVILLIAFGVRIATSTKSVTDQAIDVGDAITSQTGTGTTIAIQALQGISGSAEQQVETKTETEKFNDQILSYINKEKKTVADAKSLLAMIEKSERAKKIQYTLLVGRSGEGVPELVLDPVGTIKAQGNNQKEIRIYIPSYNAYDTEGYICSIGFSMDSWN